MQDVRLYGRHGLSELAVQAAIHWPMVIRLDDPRRAIPLRRVGEMLPWTRGDEKDRLVAEAHQGRQQTGQTTLRSAETPTTANMKDSHDALSSASLARQTRRKPSQVILV